MKLYAVTDKYIDYLRQFDYKVYDNKEDRRKVLRIYRKKECLIFYN